MSDATARIDNDPTIAYDLTTPDDDPLAAAAERAAKADIDLDELYGAGGPGAWCIGQGTSVRSSSTLRRTRRIACPSAGSSLTLPCVVALLPVR